MAGSLYVFFKTTSHPIRKKQGGIKLLKQSVPRGFKPQHVESKCQYLMRLYMYASRHREDYS